MRSKKIINLRKDSLAVLHYRRASIFAPCLQEKIAPGLEKESPLGFQLEIDWIGDTFSASLSCKARPETALFLEYLELLLPFGPKSLLSLPTAILCPNAFQRIDTNPHFVYLEQSIFLERLKEDEKKAIEREERQILLLPLPPSSFSSDEGYAQKVTFNLEYQTKGGGEKRIKSLGFRWDFQKQYHQTEHRLKLTPLKFLSKKNIKRVKKKKKAKALKNPAFFWDSELQKLSQELNPQKLLKDKASHTASRALFFPLVQEESSSLRSQTNISPINELKTALKKLDSKRDRYGLCCLALEEAVNPSNALELREKFSLSHAGKEIRSHKLRAGLVFAPLLGREDDAFLRERPQLFLRNKDAKIPFQRKGKAGEMAYILDSAHPEYIKYLTRALHSIVNKWKFSYLHLTDLDAVYVPGERHSPGQSAVERLGILLKTIRHVAGKKTLLSAEEEFLWPGLYFLNSISADLANSKKSKNKCWPDSSVSSKGFERGLEFCLKYLLQQACMQHRFSLLDLKDFLDILYKRKLTQTQERLVFSITALFGGQFFISKPFLDSDICCEPDFIKMLELHSKCTSETPLPLGTGNFSGKENNSKKGSSYETCQDYPIGLYHPRGLLGLWNPRSKAQIIEFSLPPQTGFSALTRARDYWTSQYIPWHWRGKRVQIALAPFESFVAEIY